VSSEDIKPDSEVGLWMERVEIALAQIQGMASTVAYDGEQTRQRLARIEARLEAIARPMPQSLQDIAVNR
jgi:hypothetical protein